MKLLVVEYTDYRNFPLGGQTTFIRNFVRELGCEVYLVGLGQDAGQTGRWAEVGVGGKDLPLFPISFRGNQPLYMPSRIRFLWLVAKYGRKMGLERFDAVFIQSPEVFRAIQIVCPASNIVWRMPGAVNPMRGSRYSWARNRPMVGLYDYLFVKPLIEKARAIVTINDDCVRLVKSAGERYLQKVIRSSVAVDLSIFSPAADKKMLREKLGIPSDGMVVVFAGRLEAVKGLDLMLEAFRLLREQAGVPAHLLLCGDGSQRHKMENMAEVLGVRNDVSFTGILDHPRLAEYFKCADVFAMTSRHEGLPNVMLEAMACALPVVSTDVGGVSVLVRDGKTGFLAGGRDRNIFSALLAKAYMERRKLGRNACEFVRKNFSIKNVARDIERGVREKLNVA